MHADGMTTMHTTNTGNPVDADDFMVQDFNDPRLNNYDEGPGCNLPVQFLSASKADRSSCSVILRFVPRNLEINGVRNLCNKYGQVKEVGDKWSNNGGNLVMELASLADAENVISNINRLRFKVDGKVMKADFYHKKLRNNPKLDDTEEVSPEVKAAMNGNQFEQVEISKEFHLPLAIPAALLEPHEYDNQRMKILLEIGKKFQTITNGSAIHRHSPDSIALMEKLASKSMGSFNEKTQYFEYNVTDELAVPALCKNCSSFTIKFCKGCKGSFCSTHCLEEYNCNKSGCGCVSSGATETIGRKPIRTSVGRGAQLCSQIQARGLWSACSSDSDTNEDYHNIDSDIRVKPSDLPKNNNLVVITTVLNNKTVFLRSFESIDDARYLTYLNDVAEYAKEAQPLDGMPKKGDIVLVEYEEYFHRAWVACLKNDEVIVELLELGSIATIPITNLKKLSTQLQNVQRFAFKAELSGMETLKADKCLSYLYDLMENRVPLKFISKVIGSSSPDVQCELVVSATNESVNGTLVTLNSIKTGQCVMIKDIPIKTFDASATEAVVIDNSLAINGILTVAIPEHMSDMFNMHQRIQEYCKEEYKSPYTPRVNEICLAKCNDQWYRVKIDKSFGDMNPVMLFIDFSLFNKVHVNNMRRMPSEFVFPLYSVMVEIGDITDATDLKKLAETFPSMSTVSLAKVEFSNGNSDEPIVYFNVPGGLPVASDGSQPSTTTRSMSRGELLKRLRRKFPQTENH